MTTRWVGLLVTSALLAGCSGSNDKAAVDTDPDPNPVEDDGEAPEIELTSRRVLLVGSEVTFATDEAIDPESLEVGGDLGAYKAAWAGDNRLTLTPKSEWPTGPRTLEVSVADPAGNTGMISVDLWVGRGPAAFVVIGGDDATGEVDDISRPFATLQAALAENVSYIYIGDGIHEGPIDMVDGITLMGGFSSDTWGPPDATQFKTVIASDMTGGTDGDPAYAVACDGTVSDDAQLQGLTIEGPEDAYTTGLFYKSGCAAVVEACTIAGGTGAAVTHASAVYSLGSATITNSSLAAAGPTQARAFEGLAGEASLTSNTLTALSDMQAVGIYVDQADATLLDNVVENAEGGTLDGGIGIHVSRATADILVQDNVVERASAPYAVGIRIDTSSGTVQDNVVEDVQGRDATGLLSEDTTALTWKGNEAHVLADNLARGAHLQHSASFGDTTFEGNQLSVESVVGAIGVHSIWNGADVYGNHIALVGVNSTCVNVASGSSTVVFNNSCYAKASSSASAMQTGTGSRATFWNNTAVLDLAASGAGYGITATGANTLVVAENNVVHAPSDPASAGAHVDTGGAISTLRNNALYGFDTFYLDSVSLALSQTEALTSLDASGNVEVDPELTDPDGADDDPLTLGDNEMWPLVTGSCDVRQGGRDGAAASWGFTDDIDGTTRTNTASCASNDGAAGWSMGAYEVD